MTDKDNKRRDFIMSVYAVLEEKVIVLFACHSSKAPPLKNPVFVCR